ncbi:hypothetical protein ZOD2009_16473 [Haladaptatus paucihalophilus DX253]|uniref:Uncharacterized protein n=1 Tax=Haladaptatus paucihalophilus DX253 TaxID=797209 RepID=E7QWV6_HALPU|nr:hypothetical protein ZOD2009_16473 [Haladaptatus paucihalophilus DX253]SHK21604.1 hypothetical protein SAMN05444342_0976 [Haladaptatus paucihalophilus DX253]
MDGKAVVLWYSSFDSGSSVFGSDRSVRRYIFS